MFSYFGSKSKLVTKYPCPRSEYLVEPFCGAAWYSILWGLNREVWLNDKNPIIVAIWKYLQTATKKDIDQLPVLSPGDDLRDFKLLSREERWLLGFCVSMGTSRPGNILTGFAARDNEILRFKKRIKRYNLLGNIKHWKITNLDFSKVCPKQFCTFFIDPPYQFRKADYQVKGFHSVREYANLKNYIDSLVGQVIVCEMFPADWMQFRTFKDKQCTLGRGRSTRKEVFIHRIQRSK